MQVQKRNGSYEGVQFDKISRRLVRLGKDVSNIDIPKIVKEVISKMQDKITTSELDVLASDISVNMGLDHINYTTLASRIAIDNHQKNTSAYFYKTLLVRTIEFFSSIYIIYNTNFI